jgi:hypothetical protein
MQKRMSDLHAPYQSLFSVAYSSLQALIAFPYLEFAAPATSFSLTALAIFRQIRFTPA